MHVNNVKHTFVHDVGSFDNWDLLDKASIIEPWRMACNLTYKRVQVIAYTVDCRNPGEGAEKVAPQLNTGTVLGQRVDVEVMEINRQGRLAACSQPLFTKMAGVRDW